MSEFTLKIETDYPAFKFTDVPHPGSELARILRQLADELDEVDAIDLDGDGGPLVDCNDISVGWWRWDAEEEV